MVSGGSRDSRTVHAASASVARTRGTRGARVGTRLPGRAWNPRGNPSTPSTARSAVIGDGVPPRADSASNRWTVVSYACRRARNARAVRAER
ncbi:hypothetical protein ADK41_18875 [Streptomyces caelestis]|uniref:Uncharacterized protein n=1 Tax=Streptomyces caelestis TaxID=36816 RepID=A0A0M9X8G9_9ACTN|nr:hypothetical protein ADK41_18875 [Streptomyces caelestis]KOV30635.1 hypothetical protein ADK58_08110 [Streptomyces sp. XY152]